MAEIEHGTERGCYQHRRLSLRPYTGSLLGHLGPDARLAVCDGDLRLPVGPDATIRILPRRQEAA